MAFATEIQALIGTHVHQSSGDPSCGVDWTNENVYIIGNAAAFVNYVSSVGLTTGIEQAFAASSSYSVPVGGQKPSAAPIGVDADGNAYLCWFGGNGGGLIKIDGTTLTQIAVGGTIAAPPSGFVTLNGNVANILVSGTNYILFSGEGGGFAALRWMVAYDEVTYAGTSLQYDLSNTSCGAVNCAGKDGSGFGFVVSGPLNTTDTQHSIIYKADFNGPITIASLITFVPSDIDAAWTQIFTDGVCVDQTDGNIMVWYRGQTGATNQSYIVKVDIGTGAIVWQTAVPRLTGLANTTQQFSRSVISHERICIITPSPNTLFTINTSTGSITDTQTSGLAGLNITGQQCFNDDRGCIVCNVGFTNTTGSPTRLNSTPTSYTGWSVLYVAPLPPPPTPPTKRRFLAECGPVRR